LIENSQKSSVPNVYVTVDEQLLPCKARCKFIQYMANKPDKFVLKFWMMVGVCITTFHIWAKMITETLL